MKQEGFIIYPEKEQQKKNLWGMLVLTLLTVGSMVLCMQMMFHPAMPYIPTISVTIIAVLSMFFLMKNGKRQCVGGALLGVLMIGFGMVFWRQLYGGTMDFLNQILLRYNYITGQAIDYFVVPEGNREQSYIIFCAYLIVVMVMYVGFLIRRKHSLFLAAVWGIILTGSFFLQLPVSGYVVVCAVISVIGSFAYNQVKIEGEKGFALIVLVMTVMLTGIGVVYFQFVDYKPNEEMSALKSVIEDRTEEIRYGQSDYAQGNLNEDVLPGEDTRLQVMMTKPAKVYLKGFTGSIWEDNQWLPLEDISYSEEYEGMIKAYEKKGFHPLSQISCYLETSRYVLGNTMKMENITVTVKNIDAFRKYQYFPYGVKWESLRNVEMKNQDSNLLSTDFMGKETKTMTYMVAQTEEDALLSDNSCDWIEEKKVWSEKVTDYLSAEGDYRKFVYENYRDIPKTWKSLWKKEEKPLSLIEITNEIREVLKNKKEEKWYSANFASEATLMFREVGVPARYVEGYLADGTKGSMGDSVKSVLVKGTDAHAWVEIYKDGIGWIPVDVTPGFYKKLSAQGQRESQNQKKEMETQQQNQQPQKQNKEQEQKEEIPVWDIPVVIILSWLLGSSLVLGIITWAVLEIRQRVLRRKRNRALCSREVNIRIETLSAYLKELFRYAGYEESSLPVEYLQVFQRYWFAGEEIKNVSEEEMVSIEKYAKMLERKLRKESSIRKKMKIRFLL